MTEDEDIRALRRLKTFLSEGLPIDEAEHLVGQMMDRDRDPSDDRRVCFECKHYAKRFCLAIKDSRGKNISPLRFTLQRCDFFKLKGTA